MVTIALLVLVLGSFPDTAEAEVAAASNAPASTRDLARRLMSPYCPGLTLAGCHSSGAVALRDEIRARFERGETAERIERDLVRRFGSRISGTPETSGVGMLAWALPPFVAATTLLLVVITIRRSTSQGLSGPLGAEDSTAAARLADELERLDW